jgi:hypothetical protein
MVEPRFGVDAWFSHPINWLLVAARLPPTLKQRDPMPRSTFAGLLAATLLLPLGPAAAASLEGVTVPDTTEVDGKTLVLNGIGLRTLTIFQVDIYVAALYVPTVAHTAAAIEAEPGPKLLILHYLHSGSKEQVEKEYRLGEQTNCGAGGCPASYAADFDRLTALAPAVQPGDTTTYIFTQTGFRVLANNKPLASFDNPGLGTQILDGFIGPHPPSISLRTALLGIEGK